MQTCYRCSKTIDVKTQSICFYKNKQYHLECCKICTPVPIKKEKTPPPPPPPPKVEIADPKKAHAGPGRLNFNKLGTFEDTNKEVNCQDCKKKISGQRFLTHKPGEFRCKDCNSKLVEKCNMCHVPFESDETLSLKECFKDDEGHNLCTKCIKVYQEEKKKRELAKQQEELEAAKKKAALAQPKPAQVKSTFHCDCCTKTVVGEVVDFEGENYRLECYACHSCKINLKYRAAFREDKGLACEKCRKSVKSENCSDCKKKLASGEPFYKDTKLDHPYCVECYSKKNAKVCNGCKKTIEHGDKNLTLCFHNECLKTFKCHICSKILDVNEQVFSKDDKFSCSKCH